MESYNLFANFYDDLTNNVDYNNICLFVDRIIKKEGNGGSLVLDLACGTGTLACLLAKLGYDVAAADKSEEMLSIAMNKAETFGNPIFLNQSMQDLDLFGTIDAAICTLDSINHIDNLLDVKKAFEKVSLFLNKGGLFIFDVNTLYKHQNILSNNCFVYDTDDVYCVWQNQLNDNNSIDIQLDFFALEEDEVYTRFQESFSEYYYSDEFLTKALKENDLNVIAKYDDYYDKEVEDKTQRIVYVCRKDI